MAPAGDLGNSASNAGVERRQVFFAGVRVDESSGPPQPLLIFKEIERRGYLPIWCGPIEAVSLAHAHQRVRYGYSLDDDYDLPYAVVGEVLDQAGVRVPSVSVLRLENGIYFAEVELSNGARVDARLTDAVGLSLWAGAPMFVMAGVMSQAGVAIDEDSGEDTGALVVPELGAPVVPEARGLPGLDPSAMSPMELIGVKIEPATSNVLVELRVAGSGSHLDIRTSPAEGAAIQQAQHEVVSERPLAHAFFCNILAAADVSLRGLGLTKDEDDATACYLMLSAGKSVRIRAGDGIAIALRSSTPILAAAQVLDQSPDKEFPEPVQDLRQQPIGSDRSVYLVNLAAELQERFGRTGNQADLDLAVSYLNDAISIAAAGHPHRLTMLSNLGAALRAMFERTGRLADLDQAIASYSDALDSQPRDHPDWAGCVSNLANALLTRYARSGSQTDLDQAISNYRSAIEATPAGHVNRPVFLSNLGTALLVRFQRSGQRVDLDHAVVNCQEALDATPARDSLRPARQKSLGCVFDVRFEVTGEQSDLNRAIALHRDAVDATPLGAPDRPGCQDSLGVALLRRFSITGRREDLDQAVANCAEAAGAVPVGHADRLQYLGNLGRCLNSQYTLSGNIGDLDRAIAILSESADATDPGSHIRPAVLANLGIALADRFRYSGQKADMDQAIICLREALETIPDDQPVRLAVLANFAVMLQERFGRTGNRTDLDQAVSYLREAVSTAPVGYPERPAMLNALGNALRERYRNDKHLTDLDDAIDCYAQAVRETPAGDTDRPAALSSLGNAFGIRFDIYGQQVDMDRAVSYLRKAVDGVDADSPRRSRMLVDLGLALRTRARRTGGQADLDSALDAFRQGQAVLTAPPAARLSAAHHWGVCALSAGDAAAALEGYSAAIELLPVVAWHGLDQATQEHQLEQWTGLASDAAAAAVIAGHQAQAVELLEAGRSLLWSRASRLRQDLIALAARAPDLAAALEASRDVLSASNFRRFPGNGIATGAGQAKAAEQKLLQQRREAARSWDTAVEQVRLMDGFERFLRPVAFADLRPAASEGPVVIVNISRHGSHALIVTEEPRPGTLVRVVDLPQASVADVTKQANDLLAALRTTADPEAISRRADDRDTVFDILAWIWHYITEPVLRDLGYTKTPESSVEAWPRVWWCPTGAATALPLHAAGLHPRSRPQHRSMGEEAAIARTVAGRVVSSYAPTLVSLTRARQRPESGQMRLLAAGVPDAPRYAPGAGRLPGVQDEFAVMARQIPATERVTWLLGPAATSQAVLEALTGHSWVHLSSHATQNALDASLSAFLLYDQPLTLADLSALNLRNTDMAYLAACQTATGDLRLPDEALHLAGALQLLGYRHVLATMWSISDRAAPFMADIIYGHLLDVRSGELSRSRRPQAANAPYALHHAVTRLRQEWPGEPLLWAPYIHLGP